MEKTAKGRGYGGSGNSEYGVRGTSDKYIGSGSDGKKCVRGMTSGYKGDGGRYNQRISDGYKGEVVVMVVGKV